MEKEEFIKFRKHLIGPEGCDFASEGTRTGKCDGNFAITVKLLNKYFPKENMVKFIERCRELGGFCDCGVAFKVESF